MTMAGINKDIAKIIGNYSKPTIFMLSSGINDYAFYFAGDSIDDVVKVIFHNKYNIVGLNDFIQYIIQYNSENINENVWCDCHDDRRWTNCWSCALQHFRSFKNIIKPFIREIKVHYDANK